MRAALLVLLAAGCGGANGYCTTVACAQSPCTPGCSFEPVDPNGSCSPRVQRDQFEQCPGFCGLSSSLTIGCATYQSTGECAACMPMFGSASCLTVDPKVDYAAGGAICSTGQTCYDDRFHLADLAPNCRDMSSADSAEPIDQSVPPDGGPDGTAIDQLLDGAGD